MSKEADICIVCEGSYPYMRGGVAEWTDSMIRSMPDKTFHVIALMPLNEEVKMRYDLPENVIGFSTFTVQKLSKGVHAYRTPKETWDVVGDLLKGIIHDKEFDKFEPILEYFEKHRGIVGRRVLAESKNSWRFFLELYKELIPSGPFKAYFGTIFALSQSIFSLIEPVLPKAKIYHAVCTGYAGFMLYRAKKELNAHCIVTEHGVYSNERRIEIAMSDWIIEMGALDLALEDKKQTLKDFWLNAFFSLSYVCYQSCDEILTTIDENRKVQIEAGADINKMRTIPYGVDLQEYDQIKRNPNPSAPIIAFIGRVVPIKDVKSFIRACKIISDEMSDAQFYIMGPTNEDEQYFEESKDLVRLLGIEGKVQFLGSVNVKEYLSKIDVLVLTSISEAQPLVMLEAGAVGIPCVATDVGSCEQMIYGNDKEDPPLGSGGIVTPLVNPEATAEGVLKLLKDPEFYKNCSTAIRDRIHTYYRKDVHNEEYRKIYNKYLGKGE